MNLIKRLINNEWFWLIIILLLGVFLRFYRLESWQYLTYDQSRDYIILKKLIIDHKFTLVGPTVSIAPGVFLPPFYYYSLIPFFWLFKLRPLGPDVYTAVLGVASIGLFYSIARKYFGIFASLVAAFAFSLNPYLVHTSRHAWNPNTIIFYILLFFFSFNEYLYEKRRKYLILAAFSLAWAVGLHLTAVVFLPFLFFLFGKEVKDYSFSKIAGVSLTTFLFIFSPLVLFDVRHNFPIIHGCLSYFNQLPHDSSLFVTLAVRFREMVVDMIRMPVVLLSGLFQNLNLTIRRSNITNLSQVNIFLAKGGIELFKLFWSIFSWIYSIIFVYFYGKNNKITRITVIFLLTGFLVRFFFPITYFYFYYYLFLFPFVFLIIASIIDGLFKRKKRRMGVVYGAVFVILSVFSMYPQGIYFKEKNQNYFLPACQVIADDFPLGESVVLAGNVGDQTRWEKNGLEYRYFLEAVYKLPLKGWEEGDYRASDVLYLVDEGNLPDPLKFKGMEMEAFSPKKIEKGWQVATGQKVYKMTHD